MQMTSQKSFWNHCQVMQSLAQGFCRAKFWAKFLFWRGAVQGEVFREVCGEVFHEVFRLCFGGEQFGAKFSPKVAAKFS